MKIARFERNGSVQYGVVDGDNLYSLVGDLFGDFKKGNLVCSLSEAKILAPVIPSKIVGIGLNYAAHIREGNPNREIPEDPVIFMKPVSAICGPLDPVIYPPSTSRVSYEAELAIVMGKRARKVSEAEAKNYVLGYTCGNDVSARDLQRKDGQWTRAKGFETFNPLGPYIVTDVDPNDLRIQCRINNEVRQDSRTSYLIHGVDKLVSFISEIMPLEPGDVIMTGTPDGVGIIGVGDVMEIEIEGIGVLENTLVAPEG